MKTPIGWMTLGLAGAGFFLTIETKINGPHFTLKAFGLVLLAIAWLAGCVMVGHARAKRQHRSDLSDRQPYRPDFEREGGKGALEARSRPETAEQGQKGQEGGKENGFDYE